MNQKVHKAIKNGSDKSQYHIDTPIKVKYVVKMLHDIRGSNRHICVKIGAKRLLDMMSEKQWIITAAPHRGGFGGKNLSPDQTTHITIRVGNSYHLRLDAKGHLFMITGPGVENPVMPWVAPGSR